MGTVDNWKLLRKKAEELKMFTLPSSSRYSPGRSFDVYLDEVLPILDQFIRTYEGDVENDFWDTVFNYTKKGVRGGLGYVEKELCLLLLLPSVHFYHVQGSRRRVRFVSSPLFRLSSAWFRFGRFTFGKLCSGFYFSARKVGQFGRRRYRMVVVCCRRLP